MVKSWTQSYIGNNWYAALHAEEIDMKQTQAPLSRRTLFAGAGTAGALAAVASLLPAAPEIAPVQAAKPAPEKGGGYHLSEHVQRYFKTTRI